MIRHFLLFLHFLNIIVWVGGMFFAYFCLRPAAVQLLEPHLRLPLWVATFGHFFRYVAIAVALILLSGFAMIMQAGFKSTPINWHIMMALGLLMSCFLAMFTTSFIHNCAVIVRRQPGQTRLRF